MSIHFDPWIPQEEESEAESTRVRNKLPRDDPRDALRLSKQALEQVLKTGKTDHDREQGLTDITLDPYPEVLQSVVRELLPWWDTYERNRREESVFRLATKLGASILADMPRVRLLEWRPENVRGPYILSQGLFRPLGQEWSRSMFGWVFGLLTDLGSILSLPTDQVAVLALIAAISRSEEDVPELIVAVCREEIESFESSLSDD